MPISCRYFTPECRNGSTRSGSKDAAYDNTHIGRQEDRTLHRRPLCQLREEIAASQYNPDQERKQDALPPSIENGFKEGCHHLASPIIFLRRLISEALSFSLCRRLCTNCSAEFSKKRLSRSRRALWRACSLGTLGL